MNNIEHQHIAMKDRLYTMVEVNNQINNHTDLEVDNNCLMGVNKINLGFGNHNNLEVPQKRFNKFVWVTLRDKEQKYESMGKPYETSTPIDKLFEQIYTGQKNAISANV